MNIEPVVVEIAKLSAGAGDVVVLRSSDWMGAMEQQYLREHLSHAFPELRFMILQPQIEMPVVIHPEAEE